MLIVFDANSESKKALDLLMRTGDFADTSQAISMALVSYEAIYRSHHAAKIDGPSAGSASSEYNASSLDVRPPTSVPPSRPKANIPKIFVLGDLNPDVVHPLPTPESKPSFTVPPSNWLFGQYNK